MRNEEEMLSLIKQVAFDDDNIRAAYMEGSRINPDAPKDIFQDYDIEYVVKTTKPYREDKEWMNRFGKILYMQYPEDNVFYPSDVENCYGWQIQLADGNRIDLHVITREYALSNLKRYQILLDKDGILPKPCENFKETYWVKKPKETEFISSYSDFYWCLINVAKGLWRKEIPYAMDMINDAVRPELLRMLSWKIGQENDFCVSVGKSGKYLKNYLSQKDYEMFLSTYPTADIECIWKAVFVMCDLFQNTAISISEKQNFSYDYEMAKNSVGFLHHVKELPADAKEIYP